MPWPTDEARSDLETLAAENDIKIVWDEKMPGAHHRYRTVWLNAPHTGAHYLMNLHEMGHIADPDAYAKADQLWPTGSCRNRLLWHRMESSAWAWAFQHVHPDLLDELSATDWNKAAWCWLTYGRDLASYPVR